MAYDEGLAHRVAEVLAALPVEGKKMFGGVGYMLAGNMACGVLEDMLIVRVGPEAYEQDLAHAHTLPFDTTGRPMRGWVMVTPEGYAEDEDLAEWVAKGVGFAQSLPPK
jgi:hypothetical protein